MPRNTTDEGDDGLEANPERRSSSLVNKQDAYYDDDDYSDGDEEDLELIELERRLNEEVDEDFFTEPKRFNTIHRVIDVLGTFELKTGLVFRSYHYRTILLTLCFLIYSGIKQGSK